MPIIDWDKWVQGSMLGFPKNRMWSKIRSGEHDENGEPLYQYEDKPDTGSMDPKMADVIAEHRFVAPAVRDADKEDKDDEHCFCGWVGPHHGDHLRDMVDAFVSPVEEPVEEPKPAPKKAAAKKADKDEDEE